MAPILKGSENVKQIDLRDGFRSGWHVGATVHAGVEGEAKKCHSFHAHTHTVQEAKTVFKQ